MAMTWKQFTIFHSFEFAYLVVLAVLPMILSVRIIATLTITVMAGLAFIALVRKFTFKAINVDGQGVVITGCDTGFGHALAKRLDHLGFTVFAGCLDGDGDGAKALREWSKSGRIHVVQLDVTKEESIKKMVKYVETNCNEGLWSLVNNAALNYVGDIEFCTMDQFRKIAEVNQFGVVAMTKAFLPLIRKTKGRVVNVTSAKGRLCLPSNSVYGMAKYACEAFSDVLRLEMMKFGVKVIIIEPGDFGGTTGMLSAKSLKWLRSEFDTMWSSATKEVKQSYGKDFFEAIYTGTVGAAKDAAKSIVPVIDAMEDAIVSVSPHTRYLVNGSNRMMDYNNFFIRIRSFIPDSWLDCILNFWYNRPLPRVPGTTR